MRSQSASSSHFSLVVKAAPRSALSRTTSMDATKAKKSPRNSAIARILRHRLYQDKLLPPLFLPSIYLSIQSQVQSRYFEAWR